MAPKAAMTSGENGGGPPETIYIIRHGEKPALPATSGQPVAPGAPVGVDFEGNEDADSLIPMGWQRSGALAALFDPAVGPLQAGLRVPATLFSPSYGNSAKTESHRTYQTIQGLSGCLGLQINSPFPEGNEPELASAVVRGYSGVVLICWEHQHIPDLASAIPTTSGTAIPGKWPGDRFDVIWCFTIVPGASPVRYGFDQIPQQLLAGDSDTVISTA